jgi:surfeit locus 1 family protein
MKHNSKRNIFTVFSIILILTFLALGFWQLKRKAYKEELLEARNSQAALPEIEYKNIIENKIHRHFTFTGKFCEKSRIFIYGSNNFDQKNGYFVAMPFILDNGGVILVLRAWVKDLKSEIKLKNLEKFSGTVIKSDKANLFTPEPDLKKHVFYCFNIDKINKSLIVNFEDFIVIQKPDNDSRLNYINLDRFFNVYNRHFEYVLTWFSLAFFTFIIFIFYRKKL